MFDPRRLSGLFLAILSIPLLALASSPETRVTIPGPQGEPLLMYEASQALVIGVSDYRNGWPSLPGVKKDIAAVGNLLQQQGFVVETLLNPDHSQLPETIEHFIERFGHRPQSRLLFYFAGHGHTVTPKYGGEAIGYILPVDAPAPDKDPDGLMRFGLSMQRMEEYALKIEAKHVLFLFDSCFSGTIFNMSRAFPEHIGYKTSNPVRQFITSGAANEKVPDRSIFRQQFSAALNGEADRDKDGFVSGSELGEFLQNQVVNYSKGAQHPQYGKIRNPNLDKGDFIFQVTPGSAPTPPPPQPDSTSRGDQHTEMNNDLSDTSCKVATMVDTMVKENKFLKNIKPVRDMTEWSKKAACGDGTSKSSASPVRGAEPAYRGPAEETTWRILSRSDDPNDYKRFLIMFGPGRFADQAVAKALQLNQENLASRGWRKDQSVLHYQDQATERQIQQIYEQKFALPAVDRRNQALRQAYPQLDLRPQLLAQLQQRGFNENKPAPEREKQGYELIANSLALADWLDYLRAFPETVYCYACMLSLERIIEEKLIPELLAEKRYLIGQEKNYLPPPPKKPSFQDTTQEFANYRQQQELQFQQYQAGQPSHIKPPEASRSFQTFLRRATLLENILRASRVFLGELESNEYGRTREVVLETILSELASYVYDWLDNAGESQRGAPTERRGGNLVVFLDSAVPGQP
jgi:hypothetical protein